MAIITQYSRIAHHTITATGSTFSIPVNEDFTSGSWTINDLALSEIGVNEGDKKAYIRIGDEIKEITGGAGASSLSEVMNIGNTVSGSMYSPNGSNSSGTRLLLADNKYTLRHSNSSTVYSRIDGSYLNAEIKTVNDDNGTYGLLYAIPNQAGMVANDDNNFIQSSITAVADNVDNRVELKSQYIKLNAVDVGTVSVWRDNTRVYDLPMVDGTNGQVISTDGSGNLSFINSPAAPLSEVMNVGNTVSGSMFSPDGVSNYLTLSDGGIDLWSDAVNGLINIQVTDPNGNISINGGSLISIVDNLSNTIGFDLNGINIKASAGLSVQLGNDASSVIIGEDTGFNTGSYTVFSTSRVFENKKEETLNNTPIKIGEISMENDTVVNIEIIYNAISATGSLHMGGTIKEVWKRIGGTASKVGAGLSVIDTEFSTAAINVVETGAKDGIELEIVGESRDIVWDINYNYIRTKLDMPA